MATNLANFLVDSIQTRCIFDETLIIRDESRVYIDKSNKKYIDDNKISSSRSLSLCSILCLFFFFPRHRYRFSSVHVQKTTVHHPSNRRNNTRRLSLFISLSFFSFSPPPPPVILVALSMDFNVDCNKLRPREVVRTWERWVESSRVESPLFLRPRLFLTRLNAPLDDDKFTGVAGELIVPRFRATIYQRHLRLIDNWRIFPNRFGVNVIKFSFFVSVPFARSVENKKKENGETKCLFQKK